MDFFRQRFVLALSKPEFEHKNWSFLVGQGRIQAQGARECLAQIAQALDFNQGLHVTSPLFLDSTLLVEVLASHRVGIFYVALPYVSFEVVDVAITAEVFKVHWGLREIDMPLPCPCGSSSNLNWMKTVLRRCLGL